MAGAGVGLAGFGLGLTGVGVGGVVRKEQL